MRIRHILADPAVIRGIFPPHPYDASMKSSLFKAGIIGAVVFTAFSFLMWFGVQNGMVPLMLYAYTSPMEMLEIEELFRNVVGSWYDYEITWYIEMLLTDIVVGFLLGVVFFTLQNALKGKKSA